MPKPKPKTQSLDRKKLTPFTMERMIEYGYRIQKVEYWTPFPPPHGRRVDLFGCIDVLGFHTDTGDGLGVQSTSRQAVSARIKKIRDLVEDEASEIGRNIKAFMLKNRLQVWGWDRLGNKRRLLKVQLVYYGQVGGFCEDWRRDC